MPLAFTMQPEPSSNPITQAPEGVLAEHRAVSRAVSPKNVRKRTAEDVGQTEAQVAPGPERTQSCAVFLLNVLWLAAHTHKRASKMSEHKLAAGSARPAAPCLHVGPKDPGEPMSSDNCPRCTMCGKLLC